MCQAYVGLNLFILLICQAYDIAHNKTKDYLPFVLGLEDAATTRVVSHKLADWDQDMLWMTFYFSTGAWSVLF